MKRSLLPATGIFRRVSCSGSGNRPSHPTWRNSTCRLVGLCLVVLTCTCLSACDGEDGGSSGPTVPDDPDTVSDSPDAGPDDDTSPSDPDAGEPDDADAEDGDASNNGELCGDETCEAVEECIEGACKTPAEARCDTVSSDGELSHGSEMTLTGSFPVQTGSVVTTACPNTEDGPEHIFKFTVESDSQITANLEADRSLDLRAEFRRGACAPTNAPDGEFEDRTCGDSQQNFFAPAGSTWYAIVEKNVGQSGSFDLKISASETCSFGIPGDKTCQGSTLALCESPSEDSNKTSPFATTWECPAACQNAECAGDTCGNPVTYTVSGEFSKTITGDLSPFTPQFDLEQNLTCQITGPDTPASGPETVFRLKNVQAGQKITVDTTKDNNTNLVYISNNCPVTNNNPNQKFACVDSWDGDLNPTNSVTIEQAGTYYVIIDKGNTNTNPFNYTISVE